MAKKINKTKHNSKATKRAISRFNAAKEQSKKAVVTKTSSQKDREERVKALGFLIKDRSEFPAKVLADAQKISQKLSDAAIFSEIKRGREDLRNITMVTIDSEDTKDVDDAVSISMGEFKGRKVYELGVHIADVTNYVPIASHMDIEAYRRGTSVYLPGLVLPMLPRELSNGICSLNVGVDRFAVSSLMKIDAKTGETLDVRLCESVVCIDYKATYNQIFVLFGGDEAESSEENHHGYKRTDLEKKFKPHLKELSMMKDCAEVLHKWRRSKGALDFHTKETKVIVNAQGIPTDIIVDQGTFAENIIEEFMVAANVSVAVKMEEVGAPFIFRNHLPPEADKLEALSDMARRFGLSAKDNTGKITRFSLQKMLDSAKDTPFASVLELTTLRSMQKAGYEPENQGHYGLGLETYTHFTSPIRRYPDLFIHRVVKAVIEGKLTGELKAKLAMLAPDASVQSSETEIEAENSERLMVDIKVAEYMRAFLGDELTGRISSVTKFGLFVEFPNSAEGLLFFNSMNEYLEFDDKRMIAYGRRSGKMYGLGDEIRVKIAKVDVKMGQIELMQAEKRISKEIKQKSRKGERRFRR